MTSVTSVCNACGATYRGRVTRCPNCNHEITHTSAGVELEPGQVIDGKYEIVRRIGSGGMGEVFEVRHVHLDALRTIKVMRRNLAGDETYRNRFAREARLATQLQHPNVAAVYDFASLPGGLYYMVSEFIDGITVRQWIAQHGRFSTSLAIDIALQTLSGLEHIHRHGLLHRDLSAENIMIASHDGAPIAKIIDLGIAKKVAAMPTGDATQIGVFVGNPRYSSPEQLGALREGETVDARADVYGFGVVLYEMLAGVAPFTSTTPEGYAAKHLAMAPPPLLEQPGAYDVPHGLQDVVAKALEKNRDDRYASAAEFAKALEPFRSDALSGTTRMKLSAVHSQPEPDAGRAPTIMMTDIASPAPAPAPLPQTRIEPVRPAARAAWHESWQARAAIEAVFLLLVIAVVYAIVRELP